jgi:hypothetical protein
MNRAGYYFLILLLVSLFLALPAFRQLQGRRPDPRLLPARAVDHSVDYSNILPADYVGPETCRDCHEEQYELWRTHPHSRMNRHASDASMRGNFDHAVLKLPTGEVRFVEREGKFLMEVYKDSRLRRRYEVTRTVGSRYMQAYIGRQLLGPEPAGHDIYREHRLPFGYWFKLERWLPRVYMNAYGDETLVDGVPVDEAIDGQPRIDLYGANCMNCHNTFPYAYRIFHDYMVGFPDATVSAEIGQLSEAVSDTVKVAPRIRDFLQLNERLDPEKHLVTMGVSCESCHFGGREHAERERDIRFLPTSKLIRISADDPQVIPNGQRSDAYTTRGICTQCHSGAADLFPNGAGRGNSREAMDLVAGHCASQLSCIDCHEPHTGTPRDLAGVDLPRHVGTCARCHQAFQDQQVAQQHAGPGHDNVNCLDCHMPKFTRGVDHLIRTHRVSLPMEESMVAAGMANACNACHLDKSVRWALEQHQQIWGHALKPDSGWKSSHTLDRPAGEVWLTSPDSHMRYLATQWYAGSRWASEKFAEIASSLNDPEPVNRVFALFAVNRLLGQSPDSEIAVDITLAPQQRHAQIRQLVDDFVQRLNEED